MSIFHIPTAFFLAGMTTLIMPVFTWWSLSKSPSLKLGLWCGSGILIGGGAILFALRLHIPAWASYPLANFLIVLGVLLRIQAFRHEIGKQWPASWLAIGAIVPILIFEFIRLVLDDVGMRVGYIHSLYVLLFGYLTFIAWQLGRKFRSRSALVIASFHGLLAAGFLIRLGEIAIGTFNPDMMGVTFGGVMIAVAGLLTGAVCHMAYVGMQLELAQKKLLTAEVQYDAILNTTPDGFILADADGHFIDVNEIYCQMLGYTREEMLCMGISDVKVTSDGETLSGVLRRILERGFDRYESLHRCRDGRMLDVEVSVTYIQAPDNKLLIFVRDISERKQAQMELERRILARTAELGTARMEAEIANAVKTRFMANVSHEMRTPIHIILGFSQIGKAKVGGTPPAETLREYFEKIEHSANQLHQLIESLLKIAEAAWAEYSVVSDEKLRAHSPSQLVSQCCAVMERTAKQRDQKIIIENVTSLSVIHGDETLLHQLLEYLIGNALRYSAEGTTVTVKIQNKPLEGNPPRFSANTLTIQVMDEGCGIPEKELSAIFEPFYQSSRTATGAGGTGLGLALCKTIVKRHKGQITAKNRPEGGAIFEVTLPAA